MMPMEWLIALFGCLVFLLVALYLAYMLYRHKKLMHKNISFIESLNLTGLPIVSFESNNNIFNFVLDTGSNISIIDQEALKSAEYEETKEEGHFYGIGALETGGTIVNLFLSYKDRTYSIYCHSADMSPTFNEMKNQYGVNLHGILGSDFFREYKYILDFNELVAYSLRK